MGTGKVPIRFADFPHAPGCPQLVKSFKMMEYRHFEFLCFGQVHDIEDELMAEAQGKVEQRLWARILSLLITTFLCVILIIEIGNIGPASAVEIGMMYIKIPVDK